MMPKILTGLMVLSLVLAVLFGRERLLDLVFAKPVTASIDFRTLERSDRPNQFLVCPAGLCSAPVDLESPVFEMTATALRDRWLAMIKDQPRVETIAADPENLLYHFVQRSYWMRFPDSITVCFFDLADGKSTLAIYSRSHYGRSDFGVNENRIRHWLDLLSQ
ncbi:DUF1499 domain-containing protein [Aestuariispira insulae]|uniref:Uncharacterized protein DUF1499 n=1 Tax=Aestuariispira insulae TaxID=1461337 RepID=A0A3D9H5M3_9PROT|nr:DUF1499 domain-containing protein [Aestuariispira insulae]RED44823.1 uncharacterized protein DUF1499 [Aestuariispira insulae]